MYRNEFGKPNFITGPLLARQNAPLNNPYQFALTQDYGGPEAVCHFYLTTVSPDDPTGDHNGYGNNSGTFNVVNDAGLQPVTWALTETTTSILSPSTSANTIESTSSTSTTTNRTTSLLSTSTSTTNTETMSMSMTAIASSTPLSGTGINAPSSRGPSSGVRAGVAAGVICGVLSGAILSLLLVWKRRQKSNQGAEVTWHLSDSHQNLSNNGKELPGVEVAVELAVTPRRDELDGGLVAELE